MYRMFQYVRQGTHKSDRHTFQLSGLFTAWGRQKWAIFNMLSYAAIYYRFWKVQIKLKISLTVIAMLNSKYWISGNHLTYKNILTCMDFRLILCPWLLYQPLPNSIVSCRYYHVFIMFNHITVIWNFSISTLC